jgi:hypothetical protein
MKLTTFDLFNFIFFIFRILRSQYSQLNFLHGLYKLVFKWVSPKLTPHIGPHPINPQSTAVFFTYERYHVLLSYT